jgi:hypothetical protein
MASVDIQQDRPTRTRTRSARAPRTWVRSARPTRTWASALSTIAVLLFTGVAQGQVVQPPLSATQLDGYIAGVARAWEPYTTDDGRVADPLDPNDTGDNYGVILLADVMLKVAQQTDDHTLEEDGTRILSSALKLPVPNDPFNLLAIAAVIHDGHAGDFPPGVWERLEGPLAERAGQIGPPIGATCLAEPGCYDNWRLVWSAGASLLLTDGVVGIPGSLASGGASVTAQIGVDLEMALTHAGAPLQTTVIKKGISGHRASGQGTPLMSAPGGGARELSDPGAEPAAYELFSTFMLELIAELDPHAITPAVARLRGQADRYALQMMAPDGQLSLSGRSLDQSWVQAAAAALGARRAVLDPGTADTWRAYADRAVSYLQADYPIGPDGLLPIVPGLSHEWNPAIMDGYAALNQYEGLTLWLLSDALAQWPRSEAFRASLPADSGELLADDLGSSGLVWGRAAGVWWELSGRTIGIDPRSAQGLVAVKLDGTSGWRDLLALRPLQHGSSSVWTLRLPRGGTAIPVFARVRGNGRRVTLIGAYKRADGHTVARTKWTLSTTATGIRLSMGMPAKATLRTTVWLAAKGAHLSARAATARHETCTVTASGQACPVSIEWAHTKNATLQIDGSE